MKICWGNLDGVYLTSRGNFRKNHSLLVYKEACEQCGDPYLGDRATSKYCSKECCSKVPHSLETKFKMAKVQKGKIFSAKHRLNMSLAAKDKILSEEHKRKISESGKGKHSGIKCPTWKGGGVKKLNLPLYDTYSGQLSFAEKTLPFVDKEGRKLLQISCSKCGKFYVPKRDAVIDRVRSLNGKICGEHRFYCSQKCKDNCEVYRKHADYYINLKKKENIYTTGELTIWSREVLDRADHKCEICGETALQAHHIQPKKLDPYLALDPDNGLAVCKGCHHRYGHSGACSTGKLAHISCNE